MDIEKLKKVFNSKGVAVVYFKTGAEAADYLAGKITGTTVGIGGSKTVEAIGLYEKLTEQNEVFWHWKQEPNAARAAAAGAETYISGANGISETGEIVNIDGMGNRVASTMYGHKRLFIVAGVNKLEPTLERAVWRARNVAAPLNARRFKKNTPCGSGELKCWDCASPERICRGMCILMDKMTSVEECELVLIDEELGY